MDEVVVPFPERRATLVWSCHCGSTNMWVYSDKTIHCADCETEQTALRGQWLLPCDPEEPVPMSEEMPKQDDSADVCGCGCQNDPVQSVSHRLRELWPAEDSAPPDLTEMARKAEDRLRGG